MLMTRLRRLLNGRLTVGQVNFQRAGGIQRVRAVIERLHHDLHGAGLPRREHIIRQIRRVQPQMEPEKPKRSKKKLLSIGIGAALVVAVLVTSVLVASFGQGGKPSDNVANDPQQSEIVTPDDNETPTDETPDAETPSDDQQTPAGNAETPSSGTTGGKQEINPSTGKDKYQTDPVPAVLAGNLDGDM